MDSKIKLLTKEAKEEYRKIYPNLNSDVAKDIEEDCGKIAKRIAKKVGRRIKHHHCDITIRSRKINQIAKLWAICRILEGRYFPHLSFDYTWIYEDYVLEKMIYWQDKTKWKEE